VSSATSDVAALWATFRTSADRLARDQLILHYSPLVKYVAGRVSAGFPHNVEAADLVSYGIFGLIDAIERFDPARGNRFETYAIARIRGAIVDELRSLDWVPRSVRTKARALERAYQRLEARLKRSPTDRELAAELGLSKSQFDTLLSRISVPGVAALDDVLPGSAGREPATLGDLLADGADGPMALYERSETRRLLTASINGLPDRERVVLTLYYYESLTLADVGTVLGVTESRVSQIHAKAVLHLRARLSAGRHDLTS
jgi:RNA polymerase sigma factor for flagellar operon FliA